MVTAVEYCLVFGHNGNDVLSFAAIQFIDTFQGQVISLGRAGRKNDLARLGAYQCRHLLPGLDDGLFAFPAKGMAAAGRIAKLFREIGQHSVDYARVTGRGGIIVEVDGELYHTLRRRLCRCRCSKFTQFALITFEKHGQARMYFTRGPLYVSPAGAAFKIYFNIPIILFDFLFYLPIVRNSQCRAYYSAYSNFLLFFSSASLYPHVFVISRW